MNIKMKIFRTMQKKLAVIGLAPNQQRSRYVRQTIVAAFYSFFTSTCLSYVIYEANSVEDYIVSISTLIAAFIITLGYVSIIYKNDKLFSSIGVCENNLNSNVNPTSRALNERINQLVEKLTEIIYFIGVTLVAPSAVLPKAIYCYFIYFTTNAGSTAFGLPVTIWLPFDWKNPFVYFFVTIVETAGALALFWFLAFLMVYPLGGHLFNWTFVENWKRELEIINELLKTKKTRTKISKRFTQFIRSHSRVKQSSHNLSDIYEYILLLDFIGCSIIICGSMLSIQNEILHDTIDLAVLWTSIIFGGQAFILIFFTCELGHQHTILYSEVGQKLEQIHWYRLPIKIQQTLPTLLIGINDPVVIECNGTIPASREQFKKVANGIYTSFNLLRQMFK